MFNRKQINELDQLSLELTGVSSTWRKALNNTNLRPAGERAEDATAQKYVKIANSNRSGGTVMKFETAVAKGLFASPDKERNEALEEQRKRIEENPVVRVIPGELTFEALREMLLKTIDQEKLSYLEGSEICRVLAYRIISGEIKGGINLKVEESLKEDLEGILANLPEDLRAIMNEMLAASTENARHRQVDALTLAVELSHVIAFPEESHVDYTGIMSRPLPKPQNRNNQRRQSPEFYNRLNQKNKARKARESEKKSLEKKRA